MKEMQTMVARVEDYLIARRQMGFDLGIAGSQLLAFARFADEAGHSGPVTLDLAVRWARSASRPKALTMARRFEVLRPFAKHSAQFETGTELLPNRYFGPAHRRLAPHIYNEQEIVSLLRAASQLTPVGGLRPLTYRTIFGLLAATGLRVSEARLLKVEDVDCRQQLLTVRQTKFRKSRLVPLDPTVVTTLDRYANTRVRLFGRAKLDSFFVSDRGKPLADRTIHHNFEQLRSELGWAARGGHASPRIHDLRHTFICRTLLRGYQQNQRIDHVIDALSTYVGHAKVSDTYWYISAVPELMAAAAQRFLPLPAGGEL
jgi:integrase